MRPETTQKFIDALGTVKVSQALPLLVAQSGNGTGLQARESRRERVTLNNFAFHANNRHVAAGPRLVAPVQRFSNRPRLAA
jgi:hypothetical protein